MEQGQQPIAIIGAGVRFPGDNDTLDGFAEFLRAGRSGIRPLPDDRWDLRPFQERANGAGTIRTLAGGFLTDIDQFDAPFFNISPNEARFVDPQQRILLETAWLALENANQDSAALRGSNGGVFIGASSVDYALELESLPYEQMDPALATGFTFYPMSGRLSYFLGWQGPSLNVDTACSSSLTALHLAVTALRRGECDIALVGAVNCIHHPRTLVMFSHGGMLAADGRCKTFDEAADGFGRAEGCGVLVLKRAETARRAGDTVHALVRGTALGQDGASAGLTAPNGIAQESVLRAALADAGLGPGDIQYVEAHGTGTPIGDPIELGAINAVFGAAHVADPLMVGSLKTNIGHMEAAAGIGGIVKIILQLRDREIYPHRIDTPSGRIPWDTYPVTVPRTATPWPASTRRAVVNSFGLAGAIGVAVLEQAPQPAGPPPSQPGEDCHVFTLSARSAAALRRQVERYRRFLADHPDVDLGDLCYTTNVGRTHFPHRVADVVADHAELAALLDRHTDDRHKDGWRGGQAKTAFLFAGAGSQHVGMGHALYRRFGVFRRHVDECDQLFGPHLGLSVRAMMFGQDGTERVHDIRFTQPALFTLEYALAKLWLSWGVRPNILMGHSTGEIVAATVAGVFDLADGVAFTATRARLMQSVTAPGGMAAVQAPAARVVPLLADRPGLALAADNSPDQCVVSGDRVALAELVDELWTAGLHVTPLAVSIAAHSPLMAGITAPLREFLDTVRFGRPTVPLVSNLTGRLAAVEEIASTDYWVRHLVETVNFQAGMRAIERRGRHVFVEIGPSTALTSPATQCVDAAQHRWVASLHPEDSSARTIRRALAELYTGGLPVSWPAVHAGQERRRITLPSYVFERRRHWLPNAIGRHHPMATAGGGQLAVHPLLGIEVTTTGPAADEVREFAARISATHPAYLADNTINGAAFFPAAGYVEVLLAAQDALYGEIRRAVTDLEFHEMLALRPDSVVTLRTRVEPAAPDGTVRVRISSVDPAGQDRTHATATLQPAPAGTAVPPTVSPGDADVELTAEQVYAVYARAGLAYGPRFRRLRGAARHGDRVTGELDGGCIAATEFLPVPLLESATHLLAAVVDDGDTYVLSRCAHLKFGKKPRSGTLRAELRRTGSTDAELTVGISLFEDDRVIAELDGMVFTRLPAGALVVPDQPATVDRLPVTDIDPAGRRPAIEHLVRAVVARVLHIEDVDSIDPGAKFLQLGLNSLLAVQVTTALATALGVGDLPRSVTADHPSVELLAEFLDRRFGAGAATHEPLPAPV